MISDFFYKYYIDPIRYQQPYNIVETLTYAIILIIGVYLLYRWMSRSTWLADGGIAIDGTFVLATLPYVVLGGVLRVIQDTGMIVGDIQFAIVTPFIYFVLFFYTITMLALSRYLYLENLTKKPLSFYSGAGIASTVVIALVLLAWGMNHTHVDVMVLAIILAMAITSTLLVWGFMRYVLKWEYVADPLYQALLFGQLLDASATSYGIDFHPAVHYIEQHVVGSGLIDLTGTAFVMFPLKLVVLFPAIYIMQLYRKEANQTFWHLILFAMIVVGMGPGIRDMTRMILYV